MKIINKLIATMCLVALAACGGGGGGSSSSVPATNPGAPPSGPTLPTSGKVGTVTASGVVSNGLFAKSSMRKLDSLKHTSGLTISTVEVDGVIYPSYGGSTYVANSQTLTPVSNQISINLSFSNVPAANNEWMAVHLLANASDGSQFDLGWLGAIVNVAAGSVTPVNLGPASTQFYQAFTNFLGQNMFSSVDLANANFAATLAGQIAATGQTPDPTAQLYTPTALAAIGAALRPLYERSFTVSSGQSGTNAKVVAIVDYTNVNEAQLEWNIEGGSCTTGRGGIGGDSAGRRPAGASPQSTTQSVLGCSVPQFPQGCCFGPSDFPGFYNSVATVGPASPTMPLPSYVLYQTQPASSATFANMYDGPTLVGAFSGGPPFTGGWTSVSSIATGNPTITVPNAATQTTVAVNDPDAWGFPANFSTCSGAANSCDYRVFNLPYIFSSFFTTNVNGNSDSNTYPSMPANFGPASNSVAISSWYWINIPATQLQLCTNENYVDSQCLPVASGTINIQRSFHEYGTNEAHYNWQASGGATSAAQGFNCGNPGGLVINTDGTSTGSITSTTATYFGRRNGYRMGLQFYPGTYATAPCNNYVDMSPNATWTVTMTDTNNNTYTGSATGNQYVFIQMPSFNKTVPIKKIVLTYTMPNGVAAPAQWGINQILSSNY